MTTFASPPSSKARCHCWQPLQGGNRLTAARPRSQSHLVPTLRIQGRPCSSTRPARAEEKCSYQGTTVDSTGGKAGCTPFTTVPREGRPWCHTLRGKFSQPEQLRNTLPCAIRRQCAPKQHRREANRTRQDHLMKSSHLQGAINSKFFLTRPKHSFSIDRYRIARCLVKYDLLRASFRTRYSIPRAPHNGSFGMWKVTCLTCDHRTTEWEPGIRLKLDSGR